MAGNIYVSVTFIRMTRENAVHVQVTKLRKGIWEVVKGEILL